MKCDNSGKLHDMVEVSIHIQGDFRDACDFSYMQIDILSIVADISQIVKEPEILCEKGGLIPSTTRKYVRKYTKGVTIKELKQGSFFELVVVPMFVGIALIVIEKIWESVAERNSHGSVMTINIINNYKGITETEHHNIEKKIEAELGSVKEENIEKGIMTIFDMIDVDSKRVDKESKAYKTLKRDIERLIEEIDNKN